MTKPARTGVSEQLSVHGELVAPAAEIVVRDQAGDRRGCGRDSERGRLWWMLPRATIDGSGSRQVYCARPVERLMACVRVCGCAGVRVCAAFPIPREVSSQTDASLGATKHAPGLAGEMEARHVTVSEARRAAPTRPMVGAPGAHPAGSRWPARLGIAALVALYILGWGATGLAPINQTDLDAFFLPSARIALAGHPLQVYSLRYETLYPNANGPLSLVPLTAVAALAARLGWLDDTALRRMLVMATFSVFSLLLAREGVAAVDRLRGNPPRGLWRVLTYAAFACTPMLWHSVLLYGHVEQPMTLWLTLWSVRSLAEERPRRAGLTLGLAVLGRSMAVVYLVALLVLLCARRRWRHALWFGGAAAGAVMLGLLPFYLADRADLIFSLATFRGALPIGGGSIWALAVGGPYERLGRAYDGACVLAYAVLISMVVALVRRDLRPRDRDVYGLLMLAGMSFPLLIKTVWPYYFLDLYVLSAAWWLAAPGPWANVRRWLGLLLPLGFAACGAAAEYGSWLSMDQPERIRESVAEFVALAVITLVFGGWLLRSRGGRALPAAGAAGLAEQPSLA